MQKKLILAAGSLVYIIFLCWLSFQQLSVPEPALPGKNPNSFSAYRAIDHVMVLAKEPHSGGSSAHKQVRNYIYDFCKDHSLETKVFDKTGFYQRGSYLTAGRAYNILAKFKGTDNSKAVLVMAHYDSQPNTPGASDNSAGVSGILETISLLDKGEPLKNDIYFLFTDLEEGGLLGAEAFVSNLPELDNIGIVLNFDARGNSGANFTFETSSENGWVVNEFSKAVDNPLANSLAYEVYKMLPNDTDYTHFRKKGITGLNTGFIDGFAYYHGAADKPQALNLGSLQQMGDLMWQSVNHFGNIKLTETKSADVIFFSVFGSMFIYPVGVDLMLIILAVVLFGAVLFKLFRSDDLNLKSVFGAFGLYVGSIVLGMVFTFLIELLILQINPHFKNFYGYGFYNVNTYLISFIGSATLAYFIFHSIWKNVSSNNHLIGGLLLQVIALVLLKIYVPSGAYIIYIPMLITILILLIKGYLAKKYEIIAEWLMPVTALILWVPFVYFLFVVFSLQMPLASVIFILLTLPYLAFSFDHIRSVFRWTLPIISVTLILMGIIVGQSSASPTKDKPQLTQLAYAWNVDENKAVWYSGLTYWDDFVSAYIHSNERKSLENYGLSKRKVYMVEEAPVIDIPTARVDIVSDTVLNDKREIELKIHPSFEVTHFILDLPDSSYIAEVDERELSDKNVTTLKYFAPPKNGCLIKLITTKTDSLQLNLSESKLGLSRKLLIHPLPYNYAFGPGYTSNTMLLVKKINL